MLWIRIMEITWPAWGGDLKLGARQELVRSKIGCETRRTWPCLGFLTRRVGRAFLPLYHFVDLFRFQQLDQQCWAGKTPLAFVCFSYSTRVSFSLIFYQCNFFLSCSTRVFFSAWFRISSNAYVQSEWNLPRKCKIFPDRESSTPEFRVEKVLSYFSLRISCRSWLLLF